MSTAVATTTEYTPEDLLAMPDGKSYELVNGQLVERNMGAESSWVGGVARPPPTILPGAPTRVGLAGRQRLPMFPPRSRPCPQARCLIRPIWPPPRRGAAQGLDQDPSRPGRGGRLAQRHRREVGREAGGLEICGIPLVWVIDPGSRSVMIYRGDGSIHRAP